MTKPEDKAGQILGWSIGSGIDKKELESLVDLPGVYNFKVIGISSEAYQNELIAQVELKLGRAIEPSEKQVRRSREGKYVSITLKLHMNTLEEIYEIYAILKANTGTTFLL